jgi:hypothetical protein
MSWIDVTTAVGTAGAAVVALGLGLRAEWRATRLEREQHKDDERRQAIHVAAWILVERDDGEGFREVDPYDPSLDTRDMSHLRIYAVIQNASDEPIWDVAFNATIFVEKNESSNELQSVESESQIVSIGPHETLKLPISAPTIPYSRLPLKVEFRDNADRDWSRDERGRLHQCRTSEPDWAWMDEIARKKAGAKRRIRLISHHKSALKSNNTV